VAYFFGPPCAWSDNGQAVILSKAGASILWVNEARWFIEI